MSDLVLIRPGCTDFDEQRRVQGTLELPLNDRGEDQVDDVVQQLRDMSISAVYTSPAEPSLSTANMIGEELGVPVKEKDGLRNVDQGLWQGLLVEDVRRKFPKVYKQWCESPDRVCPPEGESGTDAVKRVSKLVDKAIKKKGCVALVAPEPLASLIACHLTGDPPRLADDGLTCQDGSRVESFIMNGNGHAVRNGDGHSADHLDEQSPAKESA